MFTPKQIAKTLTIPESTLRRWASRFRAHLSIAEHTPGQHRTYTDDDLRIFGIIQMHLADGLTYAQIESELDVLETPVPDVSTALQLQPEFQNAIHNAIESARATITSMQAQIETQNKRIEKLERWASGPMWKRLFTKPPFE